MIDSINGAAKGGRPAILTLRAVVLRCSAAVFALAAMVIGTISGADAKPTGWRAPSELANGKADAWSGYGDAGYILRSSKKGAAKSKQKTSQKTAKRSKKSNSKVRKAGLRKAIKDSGYQIKETEKEPATTKVAALGETLPAAVAPPKNSITGGGVRWLASSSCLNGALAAVVAQVAANYGSVTVNSTCRSRKHNARVGGAKRSQHLTGNAVDFRVRGNVRGAYAFLKSSGSVGGIKHYGGGLFHIDAGPRRSW